MEFNEQKLICVLILASTKNIKQFLSIGHGQLNRQHPSFSIIKKYWSYDFFLRGGGGIICELSSSLIWLLWFLKIVRKYPLPNKRFYLSPSVQIKKRNKSMGHYFCFYFLYLLKYKFYFKLSAKISLSNRFSTCRKYHAVIQRLTW